MVRETHESVQVAYKTAYISIYVTRPIGSGESKEGTEREQKCMRSPQIRLLILTELSAQAIAFS